MSWFIRGVDAVWISVADDLVIDTLAAVTVKPVAARWRRSRCHSHTNNDATYF